MSVFLLSCVSDTEVDPLSELNKKQETSKEDDEQVQASEIQLSDQEFYAYVQSIPTPLQSTALMEAIGIEFKPEFLLSTDQADDANSWFAQSIKLGIYGADMAYANVYDQTRKSIQYLGTVRSLADKLKIGQFFDVESVKKMIENRENVDDLVNTSQMNFQKMNDYLQKQERGKVSVAMILGGWVETLYLSSQVASENKENEMLHENVTEQKYALETISLLLQMYANDKYFSQFNTSFQKVVEAYEQVQVIFHEGEVSYSEDENGNLVAEDTSTTEIVFTMDDLQKITKAISDLRNDLIAIH